MVRIFSFLQAILIVETTTQDLCSSNVMAATSLIENEHPRTKAGRVYIIDFDRSRRLELDPGRQPAIELPSTQCKPPLQLKRFDPYSWDMYCMGEVFEHLITMPSGLYR